MNKVFIIKKNKKIYGTLEIFIDIKDNIKEATLMYIDIYKKYRGKGLGTYLLWHMYDYIKDNHPLVEYILWDDCSDNYRTKNNIYRNIGARYITIKGPEMIWKIQSRTKINKRKKYNKNIKGFFIT